MHIRIYLPWEIEFNEKYLKDGLDKFAPYAEFLKFCIEERYPVTVNQFRKLAMKKEHPHPDANAIKFGLRTAEEGDRGAKFVFEEVAGDEPNDNKIPQAVAIHYVGIKVQELGDESLIEGRESGGLPFDAIKAQFPELFDEAKIQTVEEYRAIFSKE